VDTVSTGSTEADLADNSKTDSASFSVTISNIPPTAGTTAAFLDDDGLPSGNPYSGVGDINANQPGDSNPSEAIYSGTLPFTSGNDIPVSIDFASMALVANGGTATTGGTAVVGQETVEYHWSEDTDTGTLTARISGDSSRTDTDLFKVEVNSTTGAYTVTLLNNVLHAVGDNDETSAPPVALTYTITDSDNSTAHGTLDITFNDDTPTLAASDLAIPNIAGHYTEAYDFHVGADTQSFVSSFDSSALTWTNARAGYTLSYDAELSSPTMQVYKASNGAADFFTIGVKDDGTYDFHLINPDPVSTVTVPDILTGITGGSNLASYTIDSSVFGGYFSLKLTGSSTAQPTDTITISSTQLGVGDNVMHGNKGDVLKLDVIPVLGKDATLTDLTINMDSAGLKTTDHVDMTVHYTTGPDTTESQVVGSDYSVKYLFDPARTVDYVTLAPQDQTVSFKIEGVGASYQYSLFPSDYHLDFGLTGSDADQDHASANFSVEVNAADASNQSAKIKLTSFEATATFPPDDEQISFDVQLQDGDGGVNTLSDRFVFKSEHLGDGGVDATITDFTLGLPAAGGDVLDISDLLAGEGIDPSAVDFDLANYLVVTGGTDTAIAFDANGTENGHDDAVQIATLTGVNTDLATLFGASQIQIDHTP